MQNSKCKICRRFGVKLFLKGEKCLSPKCPLIKRTYPPGQKRKKRFGAVSEYGKELKEKQKLKKMYNLREVQFRKYVKGILSSPKALKEDVSDLLLKILESRLDNVIFRAGIAVSRVQARQMVSHSLFLVNGKSINIPSYQVKKNDIIKVKPQNLKKSVFQNLSQKLKKEKIASWLTLDIKNLEIKVTDKPSIEEIASPVEIPIIFEYYSR